MEALLTFLEEVDQALFKVLSWRPLNRAMQNVSVGLDAERAAQLTAAVVAVGRSFVLTFTHGHVADRRLVSD